ncbi:hypothetical protein SAMN05421866_0017 [Chryseobacterium oranimense]|uniref:Uncharacterized protein n=1 Tax=Chryseobacterium oranimense TaxID=421058 RepID=A0A1M5X761_9FLAO|nr:hypothetical protein [Chryseobacterium oranimense]SHH95629.1 hypothetical protein SAMN05421866_0017 [Chryseobacterium oranimense]
MLITDSKRKLIIYCISWALSLDCIDKQMKLYEGRFKAFNNGIKDGNNNFHTSRNYHLFTALNMTLTSKEISIEDQTEFYFLFTQVYSKYGNELMYTDILHGLGKDTEIAERVLIEWESTLNDFRCNNYNKQI